MSFTFLINRRDFRKTHWPQKIYNTAELLHFHYEVIFLQSKSQGRYVSPQHYFVSCEFLADISRGFLRDGKKKGRDARINAD